ncbi:5-formyltetrahydrofolate cyclo-ligase [Psychrobacter sp. I-STPA10]|uniref:5-formyltetrahydrofolate cyclo-ligase n=1 Tax=Psychrobacter sp. I-STPA10 TaxID=2585769 RepID=UPI001E2EE630|nr:5-formyltetrahydrofolate cyclo-ligase [Psychrobacter sp. I-STPA10]
MHSFLSPTQEALVSNPPRRIFTRQRRALSSRERQAAAKHASLHLYKLKHRIPHHANVAIYYDDFGELPTQPILNWCLCLGLQPFLPVVGSRGKHDKKLMFAPIYQYHLRNIATYTHRLGMQQPQSRKLIAASQLDIIFCPLVAADKQGNRMGMGGGYYDATLAHSHHFGLTKPLKIGWCYDFQVIEQLARQSWDVPLDALITPSRIRWF